MSYYAFYSLKQENHLNENGQTANYYLDENGKEIRITEVSKISPIPQSKWDDIVYLGTVVKWSRYAEPIIGALEFERAKRERISHDEILRKDWR